MRDAPEPTRAGPCVLVVDDDRGVRRVVRHLVETWGYVCAEASSGPLALQRIADGGVALVLTDVEMPSGDGMSLVRAVAGRGLGMPPIIALSGLGLDAIADGAVTAGALAVVPKPFDPAFLRGAVDLLMRRTVRR